MIACLVTVPLVACGSGARAGDAAAVSERFHAALQAGDGRAACDELNEETASKLEQQEKKPCDEAILGLELPKGVSVGTTRVYVQSAYTSLAGGEADFLSDGPAGWKISAAGCKPTAPDQPYECELEG